MLFLVGVVALKFVSPSSRAAPNDLSPPVVRPHQIRALGRLEPEGGVLDLGAPAGARVEEILVSEGEWVKAGAPLAYFQGRQEREAEIALLAAQRKEAEERLAVENEVEKILLAENELRRERLADVEKREIPTQEEMLKLLKENLEIATAQLERLELLKGSAIPKDQIDRQKLLVNQAKREYEMANAALEKLRLSIKLDAKEIELAEQKIKANAQRARASLPLKSLTQQMALAQTRLESTLLTAPRAGRILKVNGNPGEISAGTPLLQMGNTRQMHAIAEVYETDILEVKPGQAAVVTALGKPLAGTVESVGLVVSRNSLLAVDPTAKTDARVIEVDVKLADSEFAGRLTNLQVDVEVQTGQGPQ